MAENNKVNETQAFVPPHPLNTAVLFLVFNRPDTTRQVFAAIKKAQPHRLYIAADGPRAEKFGEEEKVKEVREYVMSNIDWQCEVKTLFREKNLGCGRGVAEGITWFFENEEKGIILEDDCVPHPDFFRLCDWALDKYKNSANVWHINGNNFNAPKDYFNGDAVSFSALPQVWGWATWRDKWNKFIYNPFYLEEYTGDLWKKWAIAPIARYLKYSHIENLKKGLDTWDFQWQIAILNNKGLALTSHSNLITNVGNGPDATHTGKDRRAHAPTQELEKSIEYVEPKNNIKLTKHYEYNMNLKSNKRFVKVFAYNFMRQIRKSVRSFLVKLLLAHKEKIIVTSTGRAGSTMLTNAIAHALVKKRYPIANRYPKIQQKLVSLSKQFCDRLIYIDDISAPIAKTHDIFPEGLKSKHKFVFVFTDPYDSALSTKRVTEEHGHIWFLEHQYHLRANGEYEKLFENDVLNYEGQMKSWSKNRENVFVISYEELWNRIDEISSFLNMKVELPSKRQRAIEKERQMERNNRLFNYLREFMPACKIGINRN